jgi:putative endonuclease
MPRSLYVYILVNARKTVLYVGVTNNLARRVATHRARFNRRSFTARYNVTRLVYWEQYGDPLYAIRREKQLKAGSRAKKEALVNRVNPEWRDLGPEIGLP